MFSINCCSHFIHGQSSTFTASSLSAWHLSLYVPGCFDDLIYSRLQGFNLGYITFFHRIFVLIFDVYYVQMNKNPWLKWGTFILCEGYYSRQLCAWLSSIYKASRPKDKSMNQSSNLFEIHFLRFIRDTKSRELCRYGFRDAIRLFQEFQGAVREKRLERDGHMAVICGR